MGTVKWKKPIFPLWARFLAVPSGGAAVVEFTPKSRYDIQDLLHHPHQQPDGIGIGEEHLGRIWDRFYQVDPSRESGSGLGLGLSMVKQIVELHGGSIKVESEPGKGSRFTVELEE